LREPASASDPKQTTLEWLSRLATTLPEVPAATISSRRPYN
jgi:hypothetical protein